MAKKTSNGGNIGFEEKLWLSADKLRNNMDASEYKHVVLGLIFLKYISDSFEEKYLELQKDELSEPEDKDEYLADNIFWVPKKARWEHIKQTAKQPTIGQIIDEAMVEIEKDNASLKGVLPKNYARPTLDKHRLGELVDLISTIKVGDEASRSKDILGRVYEYFLGKFASNEGKSGGEFYTPKSVVRVLVEMIEPFKGRILDACCGSGGLFVQSEDFVIAHQGKLGDISIYGQESNPTTWRICKMNLAIRGIDNNIGTKNADSFHNDLHKNLKADYILANPPFNVSDWGGDRLKEDVRWKYGIPPVNNANYAWISHFIHHLAPNGIAGFVLANGSLSTMTTAEYEIRKNILEADLVDCIIAMPNQLFYTTGIPVCLWFVNRNKSNPKYRNRKGETLFIDARKKGNLIDRVHKELSDEEITEIANTYHNWRNIDGKYEDIKGFCKSAKLDEIKEHDYVLTPGRYVGIEDVEDDGIPFEVKMEELTEQLSEQFEKSKMLEKEIRENLGGIGFEF